MFVLNGVVFLTVWKVVSDYPSGQVYAIASAAISYSFFKDNKHYGSINCVQCKWCLTATAWFFNDGSHLETIALVMSNVPCGITEVGVIKTISSFIFNSMLLPQGDGKGD